MELSLSDAGACSTPSKGHFAPSMLLPEVGEE
jgi:hypothetical protein